MAKFALHFHVMYAYIHNIISLSSVWRAVGPEIVARGRSLVAGARLNFVPPTFPPENSATDNMSLLNCDGQTDGQGVSALCHAFQKTNILSVSYFNAYNVTVTLETHKVSIKIVKVHC